MKKFLSISILTILGLTVLSGCQLAKKENTPSAVTKHLVGIDCIKPHLISGYTIEWTQHKGHKDNPPMPVRSECVAAIEKLIKVTSELREKCIEKDKDILLINTIKSGNKYGSEAGKICAISQGTFQWWLEIFIRDNNIKDANGDYYNLTSHQFRRTLGTDMLSKGTNINVIQQVLGHSDPSVTKRFYADVKDKERAEVFKSVGVIGNINQIQSSAFDNVSEFEWFNLCKGTNQKKSTYRNDYETVFACFYRNDSTLSYLAGRRS